VVEKCEVAPATLQLSAPAATATSLYRQMSPGTVVNLSQRGQSASLSGVPLLPVAGGSSGLGHSASAAVATQSAVKHSVQPVTTQAITVCNLNTACFLSSQLSS